MKFTSVWRRITEETDIKNLTQLSKVVETTQQNVSKKKKNDEFPANWAVKVGFKYGLMIEWILTGNGPKRLSEYIPPQSQKKVKGEHNDGCSRKIHFDFLYEIDEWLLEIVTKEPFRKDWFQGFFMDACKPFADWKKRKDEEEGDSNSGKMKIA